MSHREAVLDLLNELLVEAENRHGAGLLAYSDLAELLAKPEPDGAGSWRDELEKALGLGGERALVRSVFLAGDVQERESTNGPSLGTYWGYTSQRWIPRSDPEWDTAEYRRTVLRHQERLSDEEVAFREQWGHMFQPGVITEAILAYLSSIQTVILGPD